MVERHNVKTSNGFFFSNNKTRLNYPNKMKHICKICRFSIKSKMICIFIGNTMNKDGI